MIKYFIFFILAAKTQCIFVIDNVIVNCNEKYTNLSVKISNGNQVNARLEVFTSINKMKVQVQLNVPLDKDDHSYQKVMYKSSIDCERLLKGVQGNFVIKVIMENFFKSIDFEPTFPLVPRNYTATNWTVDDSKVPIFINTKAVYEARHIGKVEGVKSSVHLFTFKAFFEINKSLG